MSITHKTLTLLAAALGLLAMRGIATADIISDLENYYSFDNPADAGHDDSGSSRDGTVSGATWVHDPVLGGAMEFDASDVVTASVPQLPGGGFTVSFWALRNSTHSAGNDGLFVAHDGNINNKSVAGWVAGNDSLWGRVRDPGDQNLPTNAYARMPGDGLWTHVVYRGDGTYYEVLLDGAPTGNRVAYNAATLGTTNSLMIGRQGSESWRGRIDDFRVYSRALTDTDVSELIQLVNPARTLKVDFGSSINNGGGPNAAIPGFIAFEDAEGSGNPDKTRTFATAMGIGGTVDVTVGGYTHFRDYAAVTGTFADESPLLSDMVLRNADGTMTLTLEDLVTCNYEITMFHHSTHFGGGSFDINVTDALGFRSVATDVPVSAGTNPASISSFSFVFSAAGSPVTIELLGGSGGQHLALNGFELTMVPEPSSFILLAFGLLGLALGGWRRKRTCAEAPA